MAQILNTEPIIETQIDLSALEQTLATKSMVLKNKYKVLITKLLQVHGTGMLHFSLATQCYELRIPDPILLKNDGPKELFSKHLYINLTKYIEQEHNAAARCVKNGKIYKILDLINMPTLENRDLQWDVLKYLKNFKNKKLLIPDNLVDTVSNQEIKIESPGDVIPITQLPDDHPAIEYLKSRGFSDKESIENLYNQFDTSFCYKQNPDLKYYNEYKNLNKGPQGKLIFFIKQFGKVKGWQSRVLEKVEGNTKYYYYHYANNDPRNGWIPLATYDPDRLVFNPLPLVPKKVLQHKYVIGYGTRASECILGFDAALDFNKNKKSKEYKTICIVEGALDAAKLGSPACCIFGNILKTSQAKLIANNFDKVYYCLDHDLAGNTLETSIIETFNKIGFLNFYKLDYPKQYKDIGEINDPEIINSLKLKFN